MYKGMVSDHRSTALAVLNSHCFWNYIFSQFEISLKQWSDLRDPSPSSKHIRPSSCILKTPLFHFCLSKYLFFFHTGIHVSVHDINPGGMGGGYR